MKPSIGRRQFLKRVGERSLILTAGAVTGASIRPWIHGKGFENEVLATEAPVEPTLALSLRSLQREAAKHGGDRRSLPDKIANLSGLNRVAGFLHDESGDVVLTGAHSADVPSLDIDALMVAFRSAFRVGPDYQEAPGCSIDPGPDPKDRWSLQSVRIIGMPRCRMAQRHVTLDYELKLAGSGIHKIEGLPSSFEVRESSWPLCADDETPEREIVSRFWFCSLYPESPRFEADDRVTMIRHPINVQVLTEQRLFHGTASEKAGPPDPIAEQFAQNVTRLLNAGASMRKEYVELRDDFRLIELGRLMRVQGVPAEHLTYLLYQHQYERVDVSKYVTGVSRSDTVQVTCNGAVHATAEGVQFQNQVRSLSLTYRGGVDAGVEASAKQVRRSPGIFADLYRRVQASRPSEEALAWSVAA